MANFPLTKPALGTYTDNVDYPQAAHVNNVNREVDAIGGILTPGIHITGMQLTWNSATSIGIGVGACACQNADIVVSTSTITKSSLSLSASTMYHVYVYLSGGSPAAEVVTTAPVAWSAGAYSKTGDTSRRYVGSILTDGSSNVYYFFHDPKTERMVYGADMDASPFRVLSSGTASTATAISLSGVTPATAHTAVLRAAQGSTDRIVYIGNSATISATNFMFFLPPVVDDNQVVYIDCPMNGTNVYYIFSGAPTGNANIDCIGYFFNR